MASTMLWIPDATAAKTGSRWTITNRALRCLVDRHRHELTAAEAVAAGIQRWLQQIFSLMDELCRSTCPWCPEPCCIVNRVWFDFQDLLFVHLNRLPLPPAQLKSHSGEACQYLSNHGCRLPRVIRPWACNQYVCATQLRILTKQPPAVRQALESGLKRIKCARLDMEDRFVRIIGGASDEMNRDPRSKRSIPGFKGGTD